MTFNHSNQKNNLSIGIWLLIMTIMTFLMIVIGGLTRLTESGLSMVDWRPILGTIPPLSKTEWINVFNNYKLTPEFNIVNKSMTLEEFKYIFWWEWFHRFFARMLGIVFLIPFLYFVLKKKISKKNFFILILVFVFGLFQALVGWWMVKSGLDENPYVSSYRLVFHLLNALIIFSILFLATLDSFSSNKIINNDNTPIGIFFKLSIILLFLTIITGGFMAGTHSGQSFNTFPLMNNKLIPDDYYFEEYGIYNFFENTVAINFNHRWLASFTFLFILSFCFYLLITRKYYVQKFSIMITIMFITVQFLLGVLALIYSVPILLGSLHQTNSVLLLASLLYAYHQHKYKKQ